MTKDEFDLIVESCKNIDRLQNTILESNMDLLSDEFEKTKNLIISLTHHLDKTEEVYNIFLKEHKKRNG
jgi:ribosomal protein S17E